MSDMTTTWISLNLAGANRLASFLLEEATNQQLNLAFALLDRAGTPLLRMKMDLAPNPSQEIALRKASTALAFRTPTDAWDERLKKASPGVRQGLPLQEGLALFGGGTPLFQGDLLVGALGISGASEAQDTALAHQAAEHFSSW